MKTLVIKLLILAALLTGFYAFGGFDQPVVPREDYRGTGRMTKAWLATVVLFVAGAVMTLWGNAIAEEVDWDIPKGLYPILGVLLLVAGFAWMLMLRSSVGR